MKILKFIPFIIIALILKSCGFENQNQDYTYRDNAQLISYENEDGNEDFKTINFTDPKSKITVSSKKYPKKWDVKHTVSYGSDPYIPNFSTRINGPNGLQIFSVPSQQYMSAMTPQGQYQIQSMGTRNVAPYQSADDILKNNVHQEMTSKGFTYLETVSFPKLAEKNKVILNKIVSGQHRVTQRNTIWQNKRGEKALVSMLQLDVFSPLNNGEQAIIWQNNREILIVDEDHFNEAVSAYVKSSMSSSLNPEWDNYMQNIKQKRHYQSVEKTNQMLAIHKKNMKARTELYESQNRIMKSRREQEDERHGNFMNDLLGDNSAREQHNRDFNNYIMDEETVMHPNGNSYQIESGYNRTWMNDSGEYIQTDDSFYDPNANENSWPWTKVKDNY